MDKISFSFQKKKLTNNLDGRYSKKSKEQLFLRSLDGTASVGNIMK